MQSFRAAIFDMDGTLVDNMAAHAEAWVALSQRLGSPRSHQTFAQDWAGRKNDEVLEALLGRPPTLSERVDLAAEKEAHYLKLYQPQMKPLLGTAQLLQRLNEAGVRCAVATAAPPENQTLVLDGLELRRWFQAVVGPDSAPRGKPAPDIFLAAAKALDVSPTEAVAFEDALNGVLSARAAGMQVAAVTTTVSAEALREAGARWTFADFNSLPPDLSQHLRLT